MADNIIVSGGSYSGTIASKDIAGVQYQRVLWVSPAGVDLAYLTGNNGTGPGVVLLNDAPVVGIDADDAVMQSANYPVYIGGRVRLGTAILAQAADGDAGGLTITGDRRLVTAPIGCPEDQGPTTPVVAANDTSDHDLIIAQAAGVKIALWGIEAVNLNATTDTVLVLKSATLGELGRVPIPRFPGVGRTWTAPFRTAAAEAMVYALTGAVGANTLYVSPLWYKTRG